MMKRKRRSLLPAAGTRIQTIRSVSSLLFHQLRHCFDTLWITSKQQYFFDYISVNMCASDLIEFGAVIVSRGDRGMVLNVRYWFRTNLTFKRVLDGPVYNPRRCDEEGNRSIECAVDRKEDLI